MSRIARLIRGASSSWRARARTAFAALVALVGLGGGGCRAKPAPGENCRVADQMVCSAHDRALVCESTATPASADSSGSAANGSAATATSAPARTWLDVACKGTHGCTRSGDDDVCDDTLATAGDSCPRSPPLDYACTTSHADALVCKDGRFELWRRCRGPQGCRVIDGRNVHCDTSLGEPDDPCERAGTFACSVDGKAMLECDGKVLVPASSCRGPKACFFAPGEPGAEPHNIDCDDGVAREGDPCIQTKRITCAADHKAELACDGHQYKMKRECRRSDCRVDGTELFCD